MGPGCRYTTFYLTRGSLTYSAPSMVADPQLGFTLAHIGTMTSIFPMAYGVSKFAAGAGQVLLVQGRHPEVGWLQSTAHRKQQVTVQHLLCVSSSEPHVGRICKVFVVCDTCAGVVSTAVSARLLLGLGLMATAAVNLAFGASSTMTAFCTLWGINGMLQVGGTGCGARLQCAYGWGADPHTGVVHARSCTSLGAF